ncbi:CocE/NonD family hydrolase [Acidobacteriota bacterium]
MRKIKRNFCFGFTLVFIFAAASALQAKEPRYPMPAPKYEINIEQSIMLPMPDGVRLSTDVYFPEGVGEKLPVVLIRTPYNKNRYREYRPGPRYSVAHLFAGQGFIVVVQDCRGRYESEGKYTVQLTDVEDGNATITWAGTQSWSNGNVGTYGCSQLGEIQIIQAKMKNPHLKAMIPQAAGGAVGSAGNRYSIWGNFYGGVSELASGVGIFYEAGSKIFYRPPPGLSREELLEVRKYFNPAPKLPEVDIRKIWWTLPVVDMMKKIGGPPTDFEDFISHGPTDTYWEQFDYIKDSDTFNVPALHVNSWYDFGVTDTLFLFNFFKKNSESALARDNQFVIISPTVHCSSERATESQVVGKLFVGDPQLDFWGMYLRWFDYWLKGIKNDVTEIPKVQIYTMGKNEWRGEQEWPLARTQFTKYFLHSDGRANSRFGTGRLRTNPAGDEPPDRFVYDPRTPVPSVGGPSCCTVSPDAAPGAYDQSEVECRHDVLVYTTPVFEDGVEVTGPMQAVLYVSSSAKDTDFTVKIVDVFPDGTAYNIQEGILRARYRDGYDKKVWMNPEGVYELKIDLYVTSNFFAPGHKIRVEISSSSFPRWERNLNTGGDNYDETEWLIAKNAVHHSIDYPSCIILPIIR